MRAVLFMFYTVETILNMCLMGVHIEGFMSVNLEALTLSTQLGHYFCTVVFYIFTVLTLFASINICTGHMSSIWDEIIRSLIGATMYIGLSLVTMNDAERDFHLMYLDDTTTDAPSQHTTGYVNPVGTEKREVEKPVHPFFQYLRAQAVCALACGVLYLLHSFIALDVLLSNEEDSDGEFHVYGDYDEDEYEDDEYIPVRLYVFGEMVQNHLERYGWFREFCKGKRMSL